MFRIVYVFYFGMSTTSEGMSELAYVSESEAELYFC
jgi:hypothetical protein